MANDLIFQIALELIPKIGNKGIKQLISYCGSAKAVFDTPKDKLLKIPGVGEKITKSIKNCRPFKEADNILNNAEKMSARVLHYTANEYPKHLKQIMDAPNILYVKGEGNLNPKRSISVVGTRKSTAYGKDITNKIIEDLVGLDVTVVSGLAYGIDIQAHKACLKNNVPTFAVLAGGLDQIYPSVHKKYIDKICELGGIMTESIPGMRANSNLFPLRNRIIAGMTDATIVVEAAIRGGALITANLADSYNKPVFAVPGDIGHSYSEGTNKLIASQKSLIYTGIEDLIDYLNWDTDIKKAEVKLLELTELEQKIYTLLFEDRSPIEIDLIAIKTQIPINQVASLLLNLEFKNLVKNLPGKKFTTN